MASAPQGMLATSLNPQTRHFNLAETRHLNFGLTPTVIAISRCRSGSYLEMSGFDVEFDSVINGLNLT
ncbi:hypothetical protein PQR33_40520 [Paraburkholderia sediminicola]|uniref:hypothetical protein n=1 Tax=Paraburkholderia sediminicola TaxID=458836 RepID=UPI0038BB8792